MIREVRIRICWLLVITPIFGKIGNTHSSQSYKRATIINYNSIESYYQHFYSSYHVRIAIYDGRTFKTLFTHFKALPKLLVDQRIEIQNVRKTFFRVLPVCEVVFEIHLNWIRLLDIGTCSKQGRISSLNRTGLVIEQTFRSNGCGLYGRAVASNTRDLWFNSSQ